MSKKSNGVGRPKILLDVKKIAELSKLQCTLEEIAAVMGVHRATLMRNYAQIIDDKKNATLLSVSSVEKDIKSLKKSNKSELSKIVAEKLAKKAIEKKISKIYFDRGAYKYHGRIKIFAETLRKNGMKL